MYIIKLITRIYIYTNFIREKNHVFLITDFLQVDFFYLVLILYNFTFLYLLWYGYIFYRVWNLFY